MKRSQGSRYMTGVSHLKKSGQRLKTCEGFIFCRGSYGQRFWDSQGTLFIDFLIEQRTVKAAHNSKLLKEQAKTTFLSKRRVRSVKSVCLFHDKARPHIVVVTSGTLKEMHCHTSPVVPELAPSDFHLFSPKIVQHTNKCYKRI